MLNGQEEPIIVEEAVAETVEAVEVVEEPAEASETEVSEEAEVETESAADAEGSEAEIITPETGTSAADVPVFDGDVVAQTKEVFDKYDFPPDVQAGIDALIAKVTAPVVDPFTEHLTEYGDIETVKEVLEFDNLLLSARQVDGGIRPNTDTFVEKLSAKDAEKANWLFHDLAKAPSTKYPGFTKFEEGIGDALGTDGEPIGAVLGRYGQFITAMRNHALPFEGDVPSYIPIKDVPAFKSLSPEDREEFLLLDPKHDRIEYDDNDRPVNPDADIRARKLADLERRQRGMDAESALRQQEVAQRQQKEQAIQTEIFTTQVKFFNEMRDTFTESLQAVEFSTDPKMQALLSRQQVTMLTAAFSEGPDGDYARSALKEAGINFDTARASQLVKDIEQSAVNVTFAKSQVGPDGKPLNALDLNKALKQFKITTDAWREFADDIIKQEKEVTSIGKAKELETAVEKTKITVKARPGVKGAGSPAVKKDTGRPPANIGYGTPEWDRWYAQQTLKEQSQRARAYQ